MLDAASTGPCGPVFVTSRPVAHLVRRCLSSLQVVLRLRSQQVVAPASIGYRPCVLGRFGGLLLAVFSVIPGPTQAQGAVLPTVELNVGAVRVFAELAATPASRQQGLMGRQKLLADHGMLFVFPVETTTCFWMRNTPLPLSIAFINSEGRIVNIANMQPLTETSHCPQAPVLYALEMQQGWFRDNGIKPGAQVQGLPSATRAQ